HLQQRRLAEAPAVHGGGPGQELVQQHPEGVHVGSVSTSRLFRLACSGDMYSGVPTTAPNPVISVLSVKVCPAALATPKSIIFGTGRSSYSATRTLDGLMSRWMTPFWWACWI